MDVLTGAPVGSIDLPRYDGGSLLNLPATICAALGVPPPTDAPPLDPAMLPLALLQDVRSVILIVVDGLGHDLLTRSLRSQRDGERRPVGERSLGPWLVAGQHGEAGVAATSITSVFPSSTVPALTTLNTGLPPSQHGLMGWWLYLEELGEPAETVRWGPAAGRGSYAQWEHGGYDPAAFFGHQTLHQHLRRHGVAPFVVSPADHRDSAFSMMTFAGASFLGYRATSTLPLLIREGLARGEERQRCFVYAYWPNVDLVAHLAWLDWRSSLDGVFADVAEEIAALDFALSRLVERPDPDGSTLVLLTADHGHVFGRRGQVLRLDLDARLLDDLICAPTGERRLVYLHARAGRTEAVRGYCQEHFGHAAHVLDPARLFAEGVFGPGQPGAASRHRAGDVVLLARDDWQFMWRFARYQRPPFLFGNHGGLDPREMEVPLLAMRV
ncbi:MAG: alkaline phosphatase family protein [Chloroflexi bacterium]|nr:alkaline phosphatase family protein [Chloroflexota bacterium]